MGFERNGASLFLKMKDDGVRFGRVLTLGHQNIHMHLDDYHRVLRRLGRPLVAAVPEYVDDVLVAMGATQVEAMDFSIYEGAGLAHDLNQPIPPQWREQFDVVFDGGGVRGGLIGVYLNLPNRSPRLRDLGESRFLEIGCPGDRLHEIGNQIGAALVLALHLCPFGIDRLGEPDQVVVAPATAHEEDDAEENQNSRATESIFLHAPSKHSIAVKRNNNFFANL